MRFINFLGYSLSSLHISIATGIVLGAGPLRTVVYVDVQSIRKRLLLVSLIKTLTMTWYTLKVRWHIRANMIHKNDARDT